ncbi:MAG TPA: SH3 domain-containing protein [Myxococcaceae bacterium]|nr:SH3 domain-containing protein [Myxococcaceae bacterium]
MLLCGLLWAGVAAAGAKPGDMLYIKARNTRILKDSSANAVMVGVLQPGDAVTWQGPDPKDKRWQRVVSGKKQGVVLSVNLTAEKPKAEVMGVTGKEAADTNAWGSSGAASKALGPGAIQYAKELKSKTAADQLQRAEKMAKTVGPREVAEHARKAGLREAVGASDQVAEVKP